MKKARLYLAVDIGATKILTALVAEPGDILSRRRTLTPRNAGREAVMAAVIETVRTLLSHSDVGSDAITALGVAAAGVVDPKKGRVVFSPNMPTSGLNVAERLANGFSVPVALGNDTNAGILAEKWLGAARRAASAVGIFVGTGIGGGFVRKGKLWRGYRNSALEVGHMVVQADGPQCGCGNFGCLEALASRTAIERDVRQAVAAGRTTILTELSDDLSVIRSGLLREALEAGDPLVKEIVHKAARALGLGCLNVRHLLDPEVIVLGGGVIEACGDFILPVVEEVLASDGLTGSRQGGQVLLAALGDDAMVLGAAALARMKVGRSPFKKRYAALPTYPSIGRSGAKLTVGPWRIAGDFCVRVNGQVKKRKKHSQQADPSAIGAGELAKACKGGPEVIYIGCGRGASATLTEDARRYLARRVIGCELLATDLAIEAYNGSKCRKAALFHVE